MPELLNQGLTLTVFGMGLVFAALVLLWGLMALLMHLVRPAPSAGGPDAAEVSLSGSAVSDAHGLDTSGGSALAVGPRGGADSLRSGPEPAGGTKAQMAESEAESRTAERARVAAMAAGALMANAVPLLMEVPLGPAFEHGRTAPCWISTNRARALETWQPPRAAE